MSTRLQMNFVFGGLLFCLMSWRSIEAQTQDTAAAAAMDEAGRVGVSWSPEAMAAAAAAGSAVMNNLNNAPSDASNGGDGGAQFEATGVMGAEPGRTSPEPEFAVVSTVLQALLPGHCWGDLMCGDGELCCNHKCVFTECCKNEHCISRGFIQRPICCGGLCEECCTNADCILPNPSSIHGGFCNEDTKKCGQCGGNPICDVSCDKGQVKRFPTWLYADGGGGGIAASLFDTITQGTITTGRQPQAEESNLDYTCCLSMNSGRTQCVPTGTSSGDAFLWTIGASGLLGDAICGIGKTEVTCGTGAEGAAAPIRPNGGDTEDQIAALLAAAAIASSSVSSTSVDETVASPAVAAAGGPAPRAESTADAPAGPFINVLSGRNGRRLLDTV